MTPTSIYLASRSPRRRDLLKQINVRFDPLLLRLTAPRGADVDELQRPGEAAADYVERIARDKAEFALNVLRMRTMQFRPVLAADTVVIVDGQVLGKPADRDQATEFLERMSGRSHEVRTAVALAIGGPVLTAVAVTQVTLRHLADAEIARYVASGEPFDKAGGYGIQGVAAIFVERIEGSYSNVVGLPLYETAQLLARAGLALL